MAGDHPCLLWLSGPSSIMPVLQQRRLQFWRAHLISEEAHVQVVQEVARRHGGEHEGQPRVGVDAVGREVRAPHDVQRDRQLHSMVGINMRSRHEHDPFPEFKPNSCRSQAGSGVFSRTSQVWYAWAAQDVQRHQQLQVTSTSRRLQLRSSFDYMLGCYSSRAAESGPWAQGQSARNCQPCCMRWSGPLPKHAISTAWTPQAHLDCKVKESDDAGDSLADGVLHALVQILVALEEGAQVMAGRPSPEQRLTASKAQACSAPRVSWGSGDVLGLVRLVRLVQHERPACWHAEFVLVMQTETHEAACCYWGCHHQLRASL